MLTHAFLSSARWWWWRRFYRSTAQSLYDVIYINWCHIYTASKTKIREDATNLTPREIELSDNLIIGNITKKREIERGVKGQQLYIFFWYQISGRVMRDYQALVMMMMMCTIIFRHAYKCSSDDDNVSLPATAAAAVVRVR